MFKFRLVDQDFFETDPVRYASALGEDGLAAYRQAVAQYPGADSFAVRYARERLAILGDTPGSANDQPPTASAAAAEGFCSGPEVSRSALRGRVSGRRRRGRL